MQIQTHAAVGGAGPLLEGQSRLAAAALLQRVAPGRWQQVRAHTSQHVHKNAAMYVNLSLVHVCPCSRCVHHQLLAFSLQPSTSHSEPAALPQQLQKGQ
jgi:hypothetical protein